MGWVDIALSGMLGVSTLVGVLRGLIREVLSLLGWGVAYFAAHWLAPDLALRLPWGERGAMVNLGAAYGLVFLLALLLWGILSWLIGQLVRASPLAGPDRLLGTVFGLLRGVVIGLVVVTLVGLTPLVRAPAWQESVGVRWLQLAIDGLRPMFPEQWVTEMFRASGAGEDRGAPVEVRELKHER